MNQLRKFLLGAGVAALVAGGATVANAQSNVDTATTSVTILRPITVEKTADLNFGTIVRPAANATVSLSTGGVVTGATSLGSGQTAAVFVVNGEGAQVFTIQEVASLTGLTLTVFKDITNSGLDGTGLAAGGTGKLSGTLGGAGTATLTYGGSFPITPTTATGTHTGTLQVTVNYQ